MPFILPLAYLVVAGAAWSVTFQKKFSSSLAPALLLHIIFLLVTGMLCHSLKAGIVLGCLLYIVLLAFYLLSGRSALAVFSSGKDSSTKDKAGYAGNISVLARMCSYARCLLADSGFRLFLFFYLFCWLTNIGKPFMCWDEYGHWGMFLKESLRLDELYAVSPLPFGHKDYVPAVTLFEVIWIQLCGQYAEPDVYRAIQMLMFSMMLPMFRAFGSGPDAASCCTGGQDMQRGLYSKFAFFLAVLAVMLLPFIFNTSNAFLFYHSIYCDYISGVLLFYCMMTACSDEGSACYRLAIFTLSLTIMILTKMTLMVFLPAVFLFFLIRELWICRQWPAGKGMASFLVFPVAVPVGLWFAFNKYVDQYVPNTGFIQSYDGMKLSSVLEVFKSSAESSIPYLEDVRQIFTDALFSRDVLLHGSYAVAIGGIVVMMLAFSWVVKDRQWKRTAYLATLWTLLTGIFYALVMYFLYETAFSEREARNLASYERYMNTFIVCAALLALYVFYAGRLWMKYRKVLPAFVLAVVSFMALYWPAVDFDQAVPAFLTHDMQDTKDFRDMAGQINTVPEEARIFELTRGENGWFCVGLRYYCAPRVVDGGSIGKKVYDGDVWTRDLSVELFVKEVGKYDYFYVNSVDVPFMEQYRTAFRDPHIIANKVLYKIEGTSGGVLDLSVSNSRSGSLKE